MSGTIKMETERYMEYVGKIKSESEALINQNEKPAEPDGECLNNVVIPDYVVANEEALDTIKRFQAVFLTVGKVMDSIKTNYDELVDEEKSKELEEQSNSSSGVSDSASTGSEIDDSDGDN